MAFERPGTTVEFNATSSSLTVPTGTVAGETGLFFLTGSTTAPSSLTLSKAGVTFTTIQGVTLANNSWSAIVSATGLVAGDTVDITLGSTALTVATHTYWSDTFSTLGTLYTRPSSSTTCAAPAMTCSAGQRVLMLATERTTANGTTVSSVVNSNGRTVTQRLYFQTDAGSDSSAYVGEFTETTTDTGTTTITYSGGSTNGSAIHLLVDSSGTDYTPSPSEALAITDAASDVIGVVRARDDGLGVTDSAASSTASIRAQGDPVGATDAAAAVQGISPLLAEVVGLTDSATANLATLDATFRASVSIQGTGAQNTYTFARPGTVVDTDYGFIVMIAGAGSNAPTAPSGWDTQYEGVSAGGGSARMSIYSRRYVSGDADPSVVYSTAPGSGNNISGLAFWYSGVPAGQNPTIGTVGTSGTATSAFTAPSKTTSVGGRRMLAISAMKGNGTSFPASASWAPDAVMQATRYATGLFYGSVVVGDWIAAGAGATNAQTATWDISTVQGFAVQVEVPSGASAYDKTASDPVGVTDALSLTGALSRTQADPVGLTDATSLDTSRVPADPVGITDSASGVLSGTNYTANLSDPVGVTDGDAAQTVDFTDTFGDPVALTDAATGAASLARSQADPVGVTDVTAPVADLARAAADPVGLVDSAADVIAATRAAGDPVGVTDASSASLIGDRTQPDALGVTDALTVSSDFTRVPSEPVGLTDAISVTMARVVTVADFLALTDGTSVDILGTGFATFDDGEPVTDSMTRSLDAGRPLSDPLAVTDGTVATMQRVVAPIETVGLTDSLAVTMSVLLELADAVGLAEAMTAETELPVTPPNRTAYIGRQSRSTFVPAQSRTIYT